MSEWPEVTRELRGPCEVGDATEQLLAARLYQPGSGRACGERRCRGGLILKVATAACLLVFPIKQCNKVATSTDQAVMTIRLVKAHLAPAKVGAVQQQVNAQY